MPCAYRSYTIVFCLILRNTVKLSVLNGNAQKLQMQLGQGALQFCTQVYVVRECLEVPQH